MADDSEGVDIDATKPVLGGIAGAALGATVAGRRMRGRGALIGAVAGFALGAVADKLQRQMMEGEGLGKDIADALVRSGGGV